MEGEVEWRLAIGLRHLFLSLLALCAHPTHEYFKYLATCLFDRTQ